MRDTKHSRPGPARPSSRALRSVFAVSLVALLGALLSVPAHAGCGCQKPPPRAAAVRPNVTYSGRPVTLFSSSLVVGQSYDVTFTAMNGATATVRGQAAAKRDQADGVVKPQLTVTLPTVPLGPASIKVTAVGATLPLLTVADTTFTVAPQPIALPTAYGSWSYPGSQAAVGRDGVVYLSLDLTGMQQPLVFEAELAGYPLRFTAKDLVFNNTQGILMQMLVQPATGEAIPGMFVYPATAPTTTSDRVRYSRHEFSTYFLQHQERLPHAVSATDDNWHLDGTPHIDHDHLIVAIIGRLNNGALPAPGATPAFNLKLRAYSLFHQGLAGKSSITMGNSSTTQSYDPATGQTDASGDVLTNGAVTLSGSAAIMGDATATSFSVASNARISGARIVQSSPAMFMAVQVPTGLPTLGSIGVAGAGKVQTIVGPGSFHASSIFVQKQGRLFVDNSAGPVTLYVTGNVTVGSGGDIMVADPNPEKFAIYMTNPTSNLTMTGAGTTFHGVVYGPEVPLSIGGVFKGAFVGKTVQLHGGAQVYYDRTLRGQAR